MDSEKPTDPNGVAISQEDRSSDTEPSNLKPTLEDLISSLVGSVQRLEVQVAEIQSDPPKWMQQFMQRIEKRNAVNAIGALDQTILQQ